MLNSKSIIGNITEHRTQNPKSYKHSPLSSDKFLNDHDEMPKSKYRSKYIDNSSPLNSLDPIEEDLELGLPIDPREVNSNSWLNMNQIEFDKLEWMSDKAEKAHHERLKSTTLFDKDGRAISSQNDKNVEGHDIESLLNLLDSTYQPQVAYALITISRIANLTTMGYYDGAFDVNLHDVMMKKFLLRTRHHMDSNNESICLNALKCMRALLCNTHLDEVVIDRIHPLLSDSLASNLWLRTSEMDNREFTIEMKDNECIEIDIVRALIERTDILTKFYYLLDVYTGPSRSIYHECVLDILIRMARHSPSVCIALSKQNLLAKVLELFLPVDIAARTEAIHLLSVKSLKLFRIVAQGTSEMLNDSMTPTQKKAIETKIPEQIVQVVEAYFFIDCYNLPEKRADALFKLHIETLRLIKTLSKLAAFRSRMASVIALGQDKLLASFRSLERLNATRQLSSMISFDWQYAAHLIDLAGSVESENYSRDSTTFKMNIWSKYIGPVLFRWIADIIRAKIIPHLDISITISTAVAHYRSRTDDQGRKKLNEVMIKPLVEVCQNGQNRNEMTTFKLLARTANDKSQLPDFLKETGRLRDPRGLPSFGTLNYNTSTEYKFKLSPVFDNESPFILLNTFVNTLESERSGTMETLSIFVENLYLNRYIRCVTGYHRKGLEYEALVQRSIVAQFEVQTITRSILLLGQYYLNYNEDEAMDMTFTAVKEPDEFKAKRVECYSNLVYYAISAIGLLNTSTEWSVGLTDQLFENVLLNGALHTRIAAETFEKEPKVACRKYEQRNLADGGYFNKVMDDQLLHALAPLYLSFKQLNRFWIFQPLLDYYENQIRIDPSSETKKVPGNRWFQERTEWRAMTCELSALTEDFSILSLILFFNCTMIYCSPTYEHLVVRPNIEDHICIIGTLFLDDNMFLDEGVSKSIAMNLRAILTGTQETGKLDSPFKDASKLIRPLNITVADFFDQLMEQFESASYGDTAFSNFLLLFLTPKSDKVFRRKLFQKETCLRILRIGPTSVWLPTEIFFEVKEQDPEISTLLKISRHIVEGSFLDEYRKFHCS